MAAPGSAQTAQGAAVSEAAGFAAANDTAGSRTVVDDDDDDDSDSDDDDEDDVETTRVRRRDREGLALSSLLESVGAKSSAALDAGGRDLLADVEAEASSTATPPPSGRNSTPGSRRTSVDRRPGCSKRAEEPFFAPDAAAAARAAVNSDVGGEGST